METPKLSVLPYKGTRDFFPEEMRARNRFFDSVRRTLQKECFEEYGGPMLESLDLYAAKSGEELAKEQTYHFEDRGGRQLAIRPEMTPTVARMVAEKIGELNFPLRWYSFPNMYRYERPQRGRLREFWQLNVDVFGCDGVEADFDCIKAAVDILTDMGADATMFTVHINNRRFFNDVLASLTGFDDASAKKVSKIVDHKGKVSREVYEKELTEEGLDAASIEKIDALYTMDVKAATALCPDSVGAAELCDLFDLLDKTGLAPFCVFDFGIVRGLDYYTGTVFEVFDNAPDNNRAMFGGGRYDNLVGLFVNNAKVSGVGFGMGDVTLENFINTHGLLQAAEQKTARVLVARFADVPLAEYMALCDAFRRAGVPCSVYLGSKKFGKQIDYAVRGGYTHVAIMGGDELAAGQIKLKDLATREETVRPRDRAAEGLD